MAESYELDLTSLQPKQWELFDAIESGIRHPFYGGARGGGKSYASRIIMIFRRLKYPKTTGLLLRRTFKQLDGNHIQPMFRLYPWMAQWYNKSEQRVYFPNGSMLQFGHCEHEKDVYNYQGLEFDDIGVEEVTQFTETIWTLLRGSNRPTGRSVKPVMWATGNPGGTGHSFAKRLWIDREFKDNERPGQYEYIPAKVSDNPALLAADPDYVSMLEGVEDEGIRRAWLEGDWDIYPGQFFSGLRRDKVDIPSFSIPHSWAIFHAIDHGTTKPTSFGRYAVSNEGKIFRLWGYYQPERATHLHAKVISERVAQCPFSRGLNARRGMADPSMWIKQKTDSDKGRAPIDEYRKVGLRFKPAINAREQGWALCIDALSQGQFFTFEGHNRDFWRTIPSLPRDEKNWDDIDTHAEDHAADEWRYLMTHCYRPAKLQQREAYSGTAGEMIDEMVEKASAA